MARAAIDEFKALAEGKRPLHNRGSLRERPTAQAAMAEAEALRSAGLAWALEKQSQLPRAAAEYRKIVAAKRKDELSARAQFQIGECLFAEKQYAEAVRELLKVDILYAYPEWSAAALYEAGRCFTALADPVGARNHFEQVQREHGKTKWAKLAPV